jgi:translocation and assembly module TamB
MRRTMRWLIRIAVALVGIPVLLVAALLLALNTGAGQREAVRLVNRVALGTVHVEGLSGRFPSALRIARIDVLDGAGTYATLHDAALDWSPLALLHRDLAVARLAAAEVAVLRRPESTGSAAGSSSSGASFSLPVRIDLAALRIDRLSLAAPVAGAAATLSVTGSAHVASLQSGRASITLTRLDAPGRYHLDASLDGTALGGSLTAEEPADGVIAAIGGLPGLGPLHVTASLAGPWTGVALRVAAGAGPLRLDAGGRVDLADRTVDLDLSAAAPAMAPRQDVSWQSVKLDAHVHGPFTRPQAHAMAQIDGLAAAGAAVATFAVEVAGDQGAVRLDATATGVRVPGPKPDLLAAAPLTLHAEATLDAPTRPVRFTLAHPLLAIAGTAQTAGAMRAAAHLDLPDLAPLAAAGGVAIEGHAALDLTAAEDGATQSATLGGTLGITGGMAPLPALIGPAAHVALTASRHGDDITLSHLALDGATASVAAEGGMTGGTVALDWHAALADLSVLAATVQGRMAGHGHIAGKTDDFAATATLDGEVATAQVPRGKLGITLEARGLPGRPAASVSADGMLDGAPLALAASAARDDDGTLRLRIDHATWRSAMAEGAATLPPGATLPVGHVGLRMTRLGDLSRLLGRTVSGSIEAAADMTATNGTPAAHLTLALRDAGLPGTATVGSGKLDATVRNPATDPDVAATLDLAGLRAGTLGGTARLGVTGRQSALAVRLSALVQGLAGADLQADANATVDVPASNVRLAALTATWNGQTLRLLDPARVTYAGTIGVDRLRLGVQQAVLEVAGGVSPTLDLTAALRNVTPDLAAPVLPGIAASGVLNAEARLTGSTAQPQGTVHLAATGLHATKGDAAGLPAANLTADATLAGRTAEVKVALSAGRNRLTLTGTAPIDPAAVMRLTAAGSIDLATLNPLLMGGGRRVLGTLTLDATATGTLNAPRASFTLTLAGGDVQDYALGAHVTDLAARISGTGDAIRIDRFTGRAGQGTLGAAGTVGLGGTMPVDLTFTARQARPLASDLLTATLDADLALRGDVKGQLAASGSVKVDRAEFRIPDKLPASVAVLDVRRAGAPPPPPPTPGPDIGLNVTVNAPGQVFISGRGMFAELAGRIQVGGTAAAPVPVGSFRLRRGSFNLAGTSLNFTSGDIRFEGSGKLDPSLNLVATSMNGNIIATLTVGGFASAPKITLSSQPQLPQDEILAQLLFGQSAASLSPVQLASAAAALAQISGVGGSVFDPLNSVRQSLGLDRLTVGGGQNGTGASVEAGKYVARNVYVGAKQAADGGGTQATVQIDLLRGLKLETDVGTGSQSTYTGAGATADPYGTSVGLTYQFRY